MTQSPPCPYCNGTAYRRVDKNGLVCVTCGHAFDIRHDVCRACGQLNKSEAAVCVQCQTTLIHDRVAQIIDARTKSREQWQQDRLKIAQQQKQQDVEASQRRMEMFWAEERARSEAIALRMAKKREQEKKTLIVVAIAAVLVVVILTVAAILVAL